MRIVVLYSPSATLPSASSVALYGTLYRHIVSMVGFDELDLYSETSSIRLRGMAKLLGSADALIMLGTGLYKAYLTGDKSDRLPKIFADLADRLGAKRTVYVDFYTHRKAGEQYKYAKEWLESYFTDVVLTSGLGNVAFLHYFADMVQYKKDLSTALEEAEHVAELVEDGDESWIPSIEQALQSPEASYERSVGALMLMLLGALGEDDCRTVEYIKSQYPQHFKELYRASATLRYLLMAGQDATRLWLHFAFTQTPNGIPSLLGFSKSRVEEVSNRLLQLGELKNGVLLVTLDRMSQRDLEKYGLVEPLLRWASSMLVVLRGVKAVVVRYIRPLSNGEDEYIWTVYAHPCSDLVGILADLVRQYGVRNYILRKSWAEVRERVVPGVLGSGAPEFEQKLIDVLSKVL